MLHVHWEIGDPALSGVSGHGNTSGCSISHGGEAPREQLWCKRHALLSWQLNCQNKACLGSGKLVLGSPCGMTVIPHPLPMARGARGPERSQSAVGVSSRWVCAACYVVCALFHSLSVLGKKAVFLAFSPGFTAIDLYRVFSLASVITKEIAQ